MLPGATDYDDLRQSFSWAIPEFYNIGEDVCDKWAASRPESLALSFVDDTGAVLDVSFGELRDQSNRLANHLAAAGVERGDRVAILLGQAPETALGHIAIYKIGAIAVPMSALFGTEALLHRLLDSGASVLITDRQGAAKIAPLRAELPALRTILAIDGATADARDFHLAIADCSADFSTAQTRADDPAMIIYTSGTTGPPKGALHAHRTLLGHLPGIEMSHDLFPRPGDKMWTPADWAWAGGLLDVLLPALHHGVPVVARRFAKFSGEAAFDLIRDHGIQNAFLPPTALKLMRAVADAGSRWNIRMRSVASGGESLGAELIDWGRTVLGVTINEFYGQTECNMVISSCAALMAPRPGVMGRPVPGHDVAIVDQAGRACAAGEQGAIAVRRGDPVAFLGYWNNDRASREKYRGDWLITGDTGVAEDLGWIRFVGRDDDVITSSGHRIGPGEIEDCLIGHAAVQMAAVVGKPDPTRTEIVKAYVVLNEGYAPGEDLAREIAEYVKTRLAAHEYPREVAFVETLPLTTTGKVIRREMRARARREAETEGG